MHSPATRIRSSRPARERRAHAPARRAHSPVIAEHPALPAVARARRAGGPEDRALYRCHCGAAFQAEVTASVGCPHCGEHQAW
ncbi:MAG: hypothetical protein QOK31_1321 [Solirubrobacteraceae bacterium]|jgi:hypothetical protein|nr:hypothetical protein [Solirubrobacteraceae bacterium]